MIRKDIQLAHHKVHVAKEALLQAMRHLHPHEGEKILAAYIEVVDTLEAEMSRLECVVRCL